MTYAKPMLFISVLAIGLIAVAAQAAEHDPNYKLVGVTSVRYRLFSDFMFGESTKDCQLDHAGWQAAIDHVASQSSKLKLVSAGAEAEEDMKRIKKEVDDGKCKFMFLERNREADLPDCEMRREEPMPDLWFFVTVAKIDNTCLAHVEATLSDDVIGQTKFKATGRDSSVTRIEMWRSTDWVKSSEQQVTTSVVHSTQAMMEELLYEWARVDCLDCDIIDDGGVPPNMVVQGRMWGTWPNANVAVGIEQDGAHLVVMCDLSAGRALVWGRPDRI